jgi:biotin operon repressor
MDKRNFVDYSFVDPILLQNPEITWAEFNKMYSVKMSDATFYNRKKFLLKTLANEANPLIDQSQDLLTHFHFRPNTKTYELVKMLIEKPEGIDITAASGALKLSQKNICDIISRLKNRKQMSIGHSGNLIYINNTKSKQLTVVEKTTQDQLLPSSLVPVEKLPRQGSLMYKILELLIVHKETGISIDELKGQLKVKRTSIYYLIHHLKKKGININSTHGIYKIKVSKAMVKSQQFVTKSDALQFVTKSDALPSQNKILLELSNLTDSDLGDALQHIKLARFHSAVYQAIIESNAIVVRLEKEIQSGRQLI